MTIWNINKVVIIQYKKLWMLIINMLEIIRPIEQLVLNILTLHLNSIYNKILINMQVFILKIKENQKKGGNTMMHRLNMFFTILMLNIQITNSRYFLMIVVIMSLTNPND